MPEAASPRPPIRSFVRREGRITPAQERALEILWPRFGIDPGLGPLDLNTIFGRRAPRHCEIGFGNGAALAAMAIAHPERDYLGVEVHRPGIGRLLNMIERAHLTNVRVLMADAFEALTRIPDGTLAAIYLLFPDPWPKKRHHKRRLVQPEFAHRVRTKLALDGVWNLATDWDDYAEQMVRVLSATPGLVDAVEPGRHAERPVTRFEERGRAAGRRIFELRYRRTG